MFYMIIVNNLRDFHDLYTSLTVMVMYFNGRNKDIIIIIIIIVIIIIIIIIKSNYQSIRKISNNYNFKLYRIVYKLKTKFYVHDRKTIYNCE